MTFTHIPLALLAVVLPMQGYRICVAMRGGNRQELEWLVPGTISMVLSSGGFALWPTAPGHFFVTPEQIFGSVRGLLWFSVGLVMMGWSRPFMRRAIAAMPRR